jgi:hypothetical protein
MCGVHAFNICSKYNLKLQPTLFATDNNCKLRVTQNTAVLQKLYYSIMIRYNKTCERMEIDYDDLMKNQHEGCKIKPLRISGNLSINLAVTGIFWVISLLFLTANQASPPAPPPRRPPPPARPPRQTFPCMFGRGKKRQSSAPPPPIGSLLVNLKKQWGIVRTIRRSSLQSVVIDGEMS